MSKYEVKRKVKKEVEEVVKVELEKYYVVRIIQGNLNKTCIAEKEFSKEPKEQDVADFLFEHVTRKDVFATVNENYRFVESKDGGK